MKEACLRDDTASPDVKAVWAVKHVLVPVGRLVESNDALTRPDRGDSVGGSDVTAVAATQRVGAAGLSRSDHVEG